MAKKSCKPQTKTIKRNIKKKINKTSEVIIKKRGRKPKVKEVVPEKPHKKRGRKPKIQVPQQEPVVIKKRGRKPKLSQGLENQVPPVVAKKRGRKPKDPSVEHDVKTKGFGVKEKKDADAVKRDIFEKSAEQFAKFGPVRIPKHDGMGGKKIVIKEGVFKEICRLLRDNYGNYACEGHLCKINIQCNVRRGVIKNFRDNFDILTRRYGLTDVNGRLAMMYNFDEILFENSPPPAEIEEEPEEEPESEDENGD